MKITYQLEFNDYREALQLAARSRAALKVLFFERYLLLLLIPFLFIVLIAAGLIEDTVMARAGAVTTANGPIFAYGIVAFLAAAPYLLVYGLLWPIFCKNMVAQERRVILKMLLIQILISMALMCVNHRINPPPPEIATSTEPTPLWRSLVGVSPWAVTLVVLWLIFIRVIRGTQRRMWDGMSYLHDPTTLEASENILDVRSDTFITQYNWRGIRGYREGEHIYALFLGPYAFLIVPKRAFATTEEVEAFRQIVEIRTTAPAGVARGFEPIPNGPPPLPGAKSL